MLRTISIGSSVYVQGKPVATLSDGRLVVSVDNQEFIGKPVMPMKRNEAMTA